MTPPPFVKLFRKKDFFLKDGFPKEPFLRLSFNSLELDHILIQELNEIDLLINWL